MWDSGGSSSSSSRAINILPRAAQHGPGGLAGAGSVGSAQSVSPASPAHLSTSTQQRIAAAPAHPTLPLHTPWTFWIDKAQRGASAAQFEASIRRIYTVNTVESFWGVFNNIPCVDQLASRYSYHLMRDDRRPIWEDDINCNGGTWRFKCRKQDTANVWKEVLVAAIGEKLTSCLHPEDVVCGVSASVKETEQQDMVQVWNRDARLAESPASTAAVTTYVRQLLPDITFTAIFYKPHQAHHAYEKQSDGGFSKSYSTVF